MTGCITHYFKCFWIGAVGGFIIKAIFRLDVTDICCLVIAMIALAENIVLEKCTKSGAGTTDSEKGEEK